MIALGLLGVVVILFVLTEILPAKAWESVGKNAFKAITAFFSSLGFLTLLLITILLTFLFWPAAVVFLLLVLVARGR